LNEKKWISLHETLFAFDCIGTFYKLCKMCVHLSTSNKAQWNYFYFFILWRRLPQFCAKLPVVCYKKKCVLSCEHLTYIFRAFRWNIYATSHIHRTCYSPFFQFISFHFHPPTLICSTLLQRRWIKINKWNLVDERSKWMNEWINWKKWIICVKFN
jgi:hypothetical protein